MLLSHSDYFIAICEEESISRAAEKLYVSQPALSKYLKNLETTLGVTLFDRSHQPLKLTHEGQIFYSFVQNYVNLENTLKKNIHQSLHSASGEVAIGMTSWRGQTVLPALLPKIRKKYPHLHLKIYEGTHEYLATLFKNNKVDFCIFHLPNQYEDVIYQKLVREKILLCVRSDDPFNALVHRISCGNYYEISTSDFLKDPSGEFILLRPTQNIRLITENYLHYIFKPFTIALEISNISTATELVRSGIGKTFVPENMVSHLSNQEDLTFYHIRDASLSWELCLAWRKDRPLNALSSLVATEIQSYFQSILSDTDLRTPL